MSGHTLVGRHRAYDLDDGFIRAWQWGDPILRNITDLLLASARGRSGRALDVGCGSGRAAVALAQAGFWVDALDVDPRVIAIAQDASWRLGVPVNYRVADFTAERDDYPEACYDLVACLEVLEHVEAWREALATLVRVLKPGGLLFLSVPHDPKQFSVLDEYAGHLRRFEQHEILGALDGLQVQSSMAGYPSFRAITWVYDRALRISGHRHAPEALRRQRGLGLLVSRLMYGLSKLDNAFGDLGWGTTLVVRAVKPR